jgi:hypothetical protein
LPFDPQVIISKLDIKLRVPTPISPLSANADPWISQTPHNLINILSQIILVKNCIARYQGSSPTPIFATVVALAKGIKILAHEVIFLIIEIYIFRKANKVLSKCRKTKKTRVRQGGALIIEDTHNIIAQKSAEKQVRRDRCSRERFQNKKQSTTRYYNTCGKTRHNTRICQEVIDISISLDSE